MKDHYQLLEIPYSADAAQIKKAFKKWAIIYHPDRNTTHDTTVDFQAFQAAYEVLIDPKKKAAYDLQLLVTKPGTYGRKKIRSDIHLLEITEKILHQLRQIEFKNVSQEPLYMYVLWLVQKDTAYSLLKVSPSDRIEIFINHILEINNVLISKFQIPILEGIKSLAIALNISLNRDIIDQKISTARQKERTRKAIPYIIIGVAILICILLFMIGRR